MPTPTSNYVEKRRENRTPLHANVDITVVADKQTIIARCCNMSSSGILVQAPCSIKVGSALSITLSETKANSEKGIGFAADGEVIRVVKDDNFYLIAIKLDNIQR